jgi:hypothetical protein
MTKQEKITLAALISAVSEKDRAAEKFLFHLEHSTDPEKRMSAYRKLTLANAVYDEMRAAAETLLKDD